MEGKKTHNPEGGKSKGERKGGGGKESRVQGRHTWVTMETEAVSLGGAAPPLPSAPPASDKSLVINILGNEDVTRKNVTCDLAWTVEQLRLAVYPTQHSQGKKIRLIHQGRVLTSNTTLAEVGLKQKSFLHCVITDPLPASAAGPPTGDSGIPNRAAGLVQNAGVVRQHHGLLQNAVDLEMGSDDPWANPRVTDSCPLALFVGVKERERKRQGK